MMRDGSSFEGEYKDGEIVKGRFRWVNLGVYEGEFERMEREGQGVYMWPDGRTYEGEWRRDMMDGQGVLRWPDGKEYEGKE